VLPTGYPDRYLGLVAHLYHSPGWSLVFTDGSEALFAREAGPGVDLRDRQVTVSLLDTIDQRFVGPPRTAARLHLAKLDLLLGHLEEAKLVLAPMDDLGARALRARCFLLAGDLASAETLARSLLAERGDDVQSLNLLAVIAFARGDSAAGLTWLRRALQVEPFNAEARALLDRIEKR
jgi:tetratricopeptide (TPR) repeat protein